MMVMDPVQEAFFFPPPFCRMTAVAGTLVDKMTDVYDSPADATTVDLTAEIRVNPREGDGSSAVDRVEFFKEDGIAAPRLIGVGTLVEGSDPARYRFSYSVDGHGTPGTVMTYFANCVARSVVDSTKTVPAYARPVRVRRGS